MVEVAPEGEACTSMKLSSFHAIGSEVARRRATPQPVFARYKLLLIERAQLAILVFFRGCQKSVVLRRGYASASYAPLSILTSLGAQEGQQLPIDLVRRFRLQKVAVFAQVLPTHVGKHCAPRLQRVGAQGSSSPGPAGSPEIQ